MKGRCKLILGQFPSEGPNSEAVSTIQWADNKPHTKTTKESEHVPSPCHYTLTWRTRKLALLNTFSPATSLHLINLLNLSPLIFVFVSIIVHRQGTVTISYSFIQFEFYDGFLKAQPIGTKNWCLGFCMEPLLI